MKILISPYLVNTIRILVMDTVFSCIYFKRVKIQVRKYQVFYLILQLAFLFVPSQTLISWAPNLVPATLNRNNKGW